MKTLIFRNAQLSKVVILVLLIIAISCSKDNEACEDNNTGILNAENSRSTATVFIILNETGQISLNDASLNIPPNESASITLPAGQHSLKALLVISVCSENGMRCSNSISELPERTVELDACQELSLVY
ncbi:hypothetical protein [Eudoraea chungangensis]|uniref:hypothetical protein n=1 Tax=Eudoraea chungangensis TaxID=1481905 RepID=UPI0023EC3E26|nr:hypothetical protein [Eudoraea chungangensis]